MGYLNLVGSFVYKEPLFRAKLSALAGNDAQLKTDGWAQSTETIFYQAAVPTGWTVDASNNDKALRVVGPTGGGVSGGSQAVSSNTTLNHTHSLATASDGSHTHTFANHTHQLGAAGPGSPSSTTWVFSNGGFLYLAANSGGSSSITQLAGPWQSPGALTLGTQPDHSHGTLGLSLSDFVFAYCDVLFGVKNAPAGTYTDLTSSFHTADIINFDPFSEFAANDAYNKGNLMPGGTIMIWGQSSPPTGWSRVVSLNDRMLRVVSGTGGGTGGNLVLSSGVTLNHTHSLTAVADHHHSIPGHTHSLTTSGSTSTGVIAASGFGYCSDYGFGQIFGPSQTVGLTPSNQTCYKTSTQSFSGNTGDAGGHSHAVVNSLADFVLAYLDVIQCSKDSSGEPYPYTDLTAEFAWKKLVSYQRLNNLAKNDAMIQYHTTPASSQALFYMASPPAGWTKITTQNDKCIRIVDGPTGGSQGGGSQLLSQTMVFQHTHSVTGQTDHTHTDTHTHTTDSGTQSVVARGRILVDRSGLSMGNAGGFQAGGHGFLVQSLTPDSQPAAGGAHSHGGVTDQQLSNVTLAYCDVVWASKN